MRQKLGHNSCFDDVNRGFCGSQIEFITQCMHVILSIYYEKGKLWRKCQEDVAASTNEVKTNKLEVSIRHVLEFN